MIKEFKNWFLTTRIKTLQGIPFIFALMLFILWPVLIKLFIQNPQNPDISYSHLPYVLFILSISGIVASIRGEFYWSYNFIVKGAWARFLGLQTVILCAIGGVVFIIQK